MCARVCVCIVCDSMLVCACVWLCGWLFMRAAGCLIVCVCACSLRAHVCVIVSCVSGVLLFVCRCVCLFVCVCVCVFVFV